MPRTSKTERDRLYLAQLDREKEQAEDSAGQEEPEEGYIDPELLHAAAAWKANPYTQQLQGLLKQRFKAAMRESRAAASDFAGATASGRAGAFDEISDWVNEVCDDAVPL